MSASRNLPDDRGRLRLRQQGSEIQSVPAHGVVDTAIWRIPPFLPE